jgi:hypothetical protein
MFFFVLRILKMVLRQVLSGSDLQCLQLAVLLEWWKHYEVWPN